MTPDRLLSQAENDLLLKKGWVYHLKYELWGHKKLPWGRYLGRDALKIKGAMENEDKNIRA